MKSLSQQQFPHYLEFGFCKHNRIWPLIQRQLMEKLGSIGQMDFEIQNEVVGFEF
jgi:hypothetical protein